MIGYVCQATLEPGDEVVTRLAVVPSFVLDPLKRGAVPVRVPLARRPLRPRRDARRDHAAHEARVHRDSEQPDRDDDDARRADDWFERVPDHVLTVVDEAYLDYIDEPDYPDAIAEYARAGRDVLVLRTFSKIYGLAGAPGRLRRRARAA